MQKLRLVRVNDTLVVIDSLSLESGHYYVEDVPNDIFSLMDLRFNGCSVVASFHRREIKDAAFRLECRIEEDGGDVLIFAPGGDGYAMACYDGFVAATGLKVPSGDAQVTFDLYVKLYPKMAR